MLKTGPLAELINQNPEDGSPDSTTEPVAVVQLGCVIAPTIGAEGAPAAPMICTGVDAAEVHPPTVTVYEYTPGARPSIV
jgi:hypothetical protein